MSNNLIGFPNKKERNDFLIALIVIGFFAWLFWFFLYGKQRPEMNIIPPVAEVVEADIDSDMDGVYDSEDLCPNEKGSKENNGCPLLTDTDGDGIVDNEDKCPEIAGAAASKGCPKDSDGDGVYDKDDKCPKIKFASATGCPPDTDGDGIFDRDDKCPKVKGTVENRGCPFTEAEEKILIDLQSSVEFETGRAVLKPSSKAKLDQLADIMKKRKTVKMRIEGHTDSAGEADNNLLLSRDRAESCRAYLVQKGISNARFKTKGYGEARPRASNDTPEGKQLNRRVMFIGY